MALLYILTSMYLLCYAYQCLALKDQAREQRLMLIKIENIQVSLNEVRNQRELQKIKEEGEAALRRLDEIQNVINQDYKELKEGLADLRTCLDKEPTDDR
jgi:hypothetical protein